MIHIYIFLLQTHQTSIPSWTFFRKLRLHCQAPVYSDGALGQKSDRSTRWTTWGKRKKLSNAAPRWRWLLLEVRLCHACSKFSSDPLSRTSKKTICGGPSKNCSETRNAARVCLFVALLTILSKIIQVIFNKVSISGHSDQPCSRGNLLSGRWSTSRDNCQTAVLLPDTQKSLVFSKPRMKNQTTDAQTVCSLRWWHQAMYQLDISEAYSSGTLKRNMFFFFPLKTWAMKKNKAWLFRVFI